MEEVRPRPPSFFFTSAAYGREKEANHNSEDFLNDVQREQTAIPSHAGIKN